MDNIVIRKFKAEDIEQAIGLCDEIREYHRKILNGYFMPIDRNFEEKALMETLKNDNNFAFVAVDKDEIIGILIAEKKTAPQLENPLVCNIGTLVVKQEFRKRGIGKMLMDYCIDTCKNMKIQEIKLGVFNDNINACKFYEKYGFKPLEQKMNLKL